MYSIHSQPFRRLLYEYLATNTLGHRVRDNEHEVRGHYNKSLSKENLWPEKVQNKIKFNKKVLS